MSVNRNLLAFHGNGIFSINVKFNKHSSIMLQIVRSYWRTNACGLDNLVKNIFTINNYFAAPLGHAVACKTPRDSIIGGGEKL